MRDSSVEIDAPPGSASSTNPLPPAAAAIGSQLDISTPPARSTLATPPSDPTRTARLAPGTLVGRYRIEALLGAGAMGAVYRARDGELMRDVALKQVAATAASIEHTRARLRREAQAMARIDHPAVVKIYDVGVDDDQLFVAIELVDGGTLRDLLVRSRPSWRAIVRLFVTIGRGLAAAHVPRADPPRRQAG